MPQPMVPAIYVYNPFHSIIKKAFLKGKLFVLTVVVCWHHVPTLRSVINSLRIGLEEAGNRGVLGVYSSESLQTQRQVQRLLPDISQT